MRLFSANAHRSILTDPSLPPHQKSEATTSRIAGPPPPRFSGSRTPDRRGTEVYGLNRPGKGGTRNQNLQNTGDSIMSALSLLQKG